MRRLCVIALLCFTTFATAQVNYSPAPVARQQFLDQNGKPLAGGSLCTYLAGTNTPAATYKDSTGASFNPVCVSLDAAGRASIYLGGLNYKFVLKNSLSVPQWTQDGVAGTIAALASPPPIGNTTPNRGAFTTVTATTVDAFNYNKSGVPLLAAPGPIGATTPDTINATSYLISGVPMVTTMRSVTVYAIGTGTYTTPIGTQILHIRMVGAGGGSGNSYHNGFIGAGANNGSLGGTSTFGTALLSSGGGGGGINASGSEAGGSGGIASGGLINVQGVAGGVSVTGGGTNSWIGGSGAGSQFSPMTLSGTGPGIAGGIGAGGSSPVGSTMGPIYPSGGGGGGGFVEHWIMVPAATYDYAVGIGGAGGAVMSGGNAGGAGGNGLIIIEAY